MPVDPRLAYHPEVNVFDKVRERRLLPVGRRPHDAAGVYPELLIDEVQTKLARPSSGNQRSGSEPLSVGRARGLFRRRGCDTEYRRAAGETRRGHNDYLIPCRVTSACKLVIHQQSPSLRWPCPHVASPNIAPWRRCRWALRGKVIRRRAFPGRSKKMARSSPTGPSHLRSLAGLRSRSSAGAVSARADSPPACCQSCRYRTIGCAMSHWLVSFDQVLCMAKVPVLITTFAEAPWPELSHAHSSPFS